MELSEKGKSYKRHKDILTNFNKDIFSKRKWIIKVFEGLPIYLRVFREGLDKTRPF